MLTNTQCVVKAEGQKCSSNLSLFWRAGTRLESPWTYSSFKVNANNEAPSIPVANNPGEGAWSATQTPLLTVRPALDPDGDVSSYQFEVYADPELTVLESELSSASPSSAVFFPLTNNAWHYWRVRAEDSQGAASVWSEAHRFFVEQDEDDTIPTFTFYPADETKLNSDDQIRLSWNDIDPDSNALIALYYDTDNAGTDGALIADDINEDPDGDGDQLDWDVSTIPAGDYWFYAVIADDNANRTIYSTDFVTLLEKQAPLIIQSQLSPNPVLVNTPVSLTATVDDSSTGFSAIASVEFNINGGAYQIMQPDDGAYDTVFENVSALIPGFDTADIYYLCIRVTDVIGNISSPECSSLAVNDPNSGSVKKSNGKLYSLVGADQLDPTAEGVASYSVDAKYKNNALAPSGNLSFDFSAGDIIFESTSMQWLIVSEEPRAQLGGTGILNQVSSCSYELDLYDDSLLFEDAFGIRIFDCDATEGLRYSLSAQPLTKGKVEIQP